MWSDDRVRDAAPDSALAATVVAMRSAAADVMIFAGVDADEAAQAVRGDDASLDVPAPAPTPRMPFHGRPLHGRPQWWKRLAKRHP